MQRMSTSQYRRATMVLAQGSPTYAASRQRCCPAFGVKDGAFGHDGVERRLKQLRVMRIRPGNGGGQRDATLVIKACLQLPVTSQATDDTPYSFGKKKCACQRKRLRFCRS